jgi:methionyl-tRNA formyltransferase
LLHFLSENNIMRFAFAGVDRSRGIFEAFVAAGWEPVALYTMPVDNRFDFNDELIGLAQHHCMPVQLSRIREDDLRALAQRQCDALIVAGYQWRVPDWREHLRYAVNFHPAPLPDGRGPYPLTQAILEDRREWGISCHRIAPEFDTGDMLASEHFALDAGEWHETLHLKIQLAAKRLATRVAGDFHRLWDGSRPQGEGSYWPRLKDASRTLDFTQPVERVMRVVHAYGLIECIAPLHGRTVFVRRALAWKESHAYEPGQVVHEYHRWIVIAAADGFVALLEWSALNETLRRQVGP